MLISAIGLTSFVSYFALYLLLRNFSKHEFEIGFLAYAWTLLMIVLVGIIGGCACRWQMTFAGVAVIAMAAPIAMHSCRVIHRVQSPLSMADPVTLAITLVSTYCVLLIPAGIAHAIASMDRKIPTINLCRKCKYSLRGNVSGKCPECGELINPGRVSSNAIDESHSC